FDLNPVAALLILHYAMLLIDKNSGIRKWFTLFCWIIIFPLFFIMHGVNENYGLIPSPVLFKLFGIYTAITLLAYIFSRLLFKDKTKAFLFFYFLLFVYFFFGAFYDLIQRLIPKGHFTSYTFI